MRKSSSVVRSALLARLLGSVCALQRFGVASACVMLLGCLSACSSGLNAGLQTFTLLNRWQDPVRDVPLSAALQYLRVTTNGRPALFVLGYEDPAWDAAGVEQVWYSSAGEVLRTREGRITSVLGVPAELKGLRWLSMPPGWSHRLVAATYAQVRHLGEPDSFGAIETVTVSRVAHPQPTQFAINPRASYRQSDLIWFETRYATTHPAAFVPQPSLFGVYMGQGDVRVVYTEQCPTRRYCMTLQEWPSSSDVKAPAP